jgi:hypothetical protein
MNSDRELLAKTAFLLCVGVAALALGSAAHGKVTAASATGLVFKLKEKHSSGISGSATLTPAGRHLRVVLRLSGPLRDSSPAHIHTGRCSNEPTFSNPRISSGLNSVVNRRSATTVLRTTLRELRARRYSINVHDPNTLGVIACGDIPRSS